MTHHSIRRPAWAVLGSLVLGCLTFATHAGVAPAQAAQSDQVAVIMQMESGSTPAMEMKYWVAPGRLRMDMGEGASVIWFGGDQTRMLMVQHAERRYMEWGEQQFEMMRQMMQRMPQGGGASGGTTFDPTRVGFEETGQRQQIGEWDAFEVKMTGLPDGQTGALWLTTDLDTGMFEVMARLGDVLDAMQMPMMGGGGGQAQFQKYRDLAAAQGMPRGQVVRIVSSDGRETSTMTMVGVEAGPFPASTFEPPSGYERMQMPSMPMMRPPGEE